MFVKGSAIASATMLNTIFKEKLKISPPPRLKSGINSKWSQIAQVNFYMIFGYPGLGERRWWGCKTSSSIFSFEKKREKRQTNLKSELSMFCETLAKNFSRSVSNTLTGIIDKISSRTSGRIVVIRNGFLYVTHYKLINKSKFRKILAISPVLIPERRGLA